MNQRQHKKLSRRLFVAILSGDTATVKAVLRAGIAADQPDGDGTTPLYLASVNGEADIVRLLLKAGACPDTESGGGPGAEGTALCAAACWGHTETVRELLAYGADPNRREDHGTGRSPLDWANAGPHPETAGLLTAAGATVGGRTI
ncbi:ankyrin repeat domain-containing protein [Streptomyces sp. MST-110588]|uniref:ankyrin repeat domain-containing protein n=1 Tax=Streptomyces sp. MST-110588 TaxID=2833628 RepID=UPI001F5C7D6B|nr:ankyrin repeat domain-containing protein [Streptomyces sp. MST-110588]UNO41641.1 ankyrin repeat domain-containing protein [Streptomyces sp. MST-110588]